MGRGDLRWLAGTPEPAFRGGVKRIGAWVFLTLLWISDVQETPPSQGLHEEGVL